MLDLFRRKDVLVRIFLGFFVGMVAIGMLVYLVPSGPGAINESRTAVAAVGDQEITLVDVNRRVQQRAGGQSIPTQLRGLYAQQVMNSMIFDRMLELEAKRMGIQVSDEEIADRIKLILPFVFAGGTAVSMDRYTIEIQQRYNIGVAEFEELVRMSLLQEKFRQLVTDGVTLTPDEVKQEYIRQNEKVKIEYAVLKPEELAPGISASDAELSGYFEKNKSRYRLSERRSARYVLLDTNQLRQRTTPTEEELRAYYDSHIDRYRLINRAHVAHILFKTVGKTDAEVEEIRKKAETVFKKAKSGAKFEDLAKQYSEDTSKDKGGDIGWIEPKQTVAEFEKAAFSQPIGTISDLVKTQYGFHIIKVLERQTARTQTFEEVRASILPAVAAAKADRAANDIADRMAAAVRQGGNQPIEQFARPFALPVTDSPLVAAGEPLGDLGASPELQSALYRLNRGQLSMPIKVERGYLVLTVKEIQPARQALLSDVRDKVLTDYRREKSVELAKSRAEELARKAQAGEKLSAAAKAVGAEAKTSDTFARNGSVPGLTSVRPLLAAFTLQVGQAGSATQAGADWVVYRVLQRDEAKPEEFDKQKKQIEKTLLQKKQGEAFEAFRDALEKKLKAEGKLQINEQNFKRLSNPA